MEKSAFPVHPIAHDRSDAECEALSGMSLRDFFAANAMQGDCSRTEWDKHSLDDLASWAYLVADAMLKARTA